MSICTSRLIQGSIKPIIATAIGGSPPFTYNLYVSNSKVDTFQTPTDNYHIFLHRFNESGNIEYKTEVIDSCGQIQTDSCIVNICVPNWQCEQPLNGYENDGCGNRRPNSNCQSCINIPSVSQLISTNIISSDIVQNQDTNQHNTSSPSYQLASSLQIPIQDITTGSLRISYQMRSSTSIYPVCTKIRRNIHGTNINYEDL